MVTSFFEYRVVVVEKDFLFLSVGQVCRNYFSHPLEVTVVRAKEYAVFTQALHRKIDHAFFVVTSTYVDVYIGELPKRFAHILPVPARAEMDELQNGFGKWT